MMAKPQSHARLDRNIPHSGCIETRSEKRVSLIEKQAILIDFNLLISI